MPPEQAAGTAGKPTPAQDVYSLGAVLFAALIGRPPHDEGTPLATILRMQTGPPPPQVRTLRPDVSADLAAVCEQCLCPRPVDRYPSAAALADALEKCRSTVVADADVSVVLTPAAGGPAVRLTVSPAGVVLGRSSRCGAIIDAAGISRLHCRLTAAAGGVVVEDLESRYGTWVNESAVREPTTLRNGDTLGLATHVFRVKLGQGEE
jgi:hypothetical protein